MISQSEQSVAKYREAVKSFLEERNVFEPIYINELHSKIEKNDVTIIDVLPKEKYINGHLPGAVSIPMSELKNTIKTYQPEKKLSYSMILTLGALPD